MRLAIRLALTLPLVVLGISDTSAHPGHSREVVAAESPWHCILQPEHALSTGIGMAVMAGVAGAAAMRIQSVRRRQKMQPIRVRR